jgi:hypothetical protein
MLDFEELVVEGIEVVNVRNRKVKDFSFVGRGSKLGNKFRIGKDGNRDEVIGKYKTWLWGKVKERDSDICRELANLYKIWKKNGGIKLGCYCFPNNCHAGVIGSCLVWRDGLKK